MRESRADEFVGETSEGAVAVNVKHQVVKYVAMWFALVTAFFILNVAVESVVASRSADVFQGGYYSCSQMALDRPDMQNGIYTLGVFGNCYANGGPVGVGGGYCCGGVALAAGGNVGYKQLERAAINWYVQNYGDADITAEIKNFGCYQQINILKDGKIVVDINTRAKESAASRF